MARLLWARRFHAPLYVYRVKQHFRRRPPRLGRIFDERPLYFVTFCTHRRTCCLARANVHRAFIDFARRAEHDFNVAVGRYVIMPDHVHLFVRGGPDFVLAKWIGLLKQILGKAAALAPNHRQLWQEGFFDHVLRSDESYVQKWNYVAQNPIRAGLVTSGEEWPYQGEIVYIDCA